MGQEPEVDACVISPTWVTRVRWRQDKDGNWSNNDPVDVAAEVIMFRDGMTLASGQTLTVTWQQDDRVGG
jgi:hypothetical protein